MTTDTLSISRTSKEAGGFDVHPFSLLRKSWEFNRMLTVSTLFSIGMLPVVLLAMWLDPVTITGVNGWIKPLKFMISTGIYTMTLPWLLSYVQGWQRFVRFSAWFTGVALVIENSLLIVQVLRGTTSHFNASTPFNAVVFGIMGMLIFTLSFLTLVVAIRLVMQKMADRVFGWGLRLGLLITVAGMLVAALMTSPTAAQLEKAYQGKGLPVSGAHSVGVEDGGAGLPLLGWSTEGGDLRIPHFVGLHALQVLPLLGWWLSRRRAALRWSEGQRLALVWIAGLGYLGLMGLLTWQALRGQSIVAPDSLTVMAALALGASAAIATLFVFKRKTMGA